MEMITFASALSAVNFNIIFTLQAMSEKEKKAVFESTKILHLYTSSREGYLCTSIFF